MFRRPLGSGLIPGYELRVGGGYGVVGVYRARLVESFLGHAEGINRRRHASVEDHLGNDFGDFFLGDPDVQGALNMPFNQLGAVTQHR